MLDILERFLNFFAIYEVEAAQSSSSGVNTRKEIPMKRIFPFVLVLLFLVGTVALASTARDYSAHFGDMDKDKDKAVTWDEFSAFFPGAEKAKFEEADADKNGKIDHGEWHKFKDKYGYGHQQKK